MIAEVITQSGLKSDQKLGQGMAAWAVAVAVAVGEHRVRGLKTARTTINAHGKMAAQVDQAIAIAVMNLMKQQTIGPLV